MNLQEQLKQVEELAGTAGAALKDFYSAKDNLLVAAAKRASKTGQQEDLRAYLRIRTEVQTIELFTPFMAKESPDE